MALTGVDVSRWQSTSPPFANYAFMFARATYGLKTDSMFATHIANAVKARIITGAYHFGYGSAVASPEAQAKAFVKVALARKADIWALDFEPSSSPMTRSEAARFIAEVHRLGYKIGLYASLSGFPFTLGQDFDWIAAWDSSVFPAYAEFWQYRGSPLDLDKFNGTYEELRALAAVPAVSEPPMDYSYTHDPATIKRGTIRLKGTGHYYLLLGDGTLHGPLDPAAPAWIDRPAIGPVTLTKPIPGGPAGQDRVTAFLIGRDAAALLAFSVTFTEAPDPTPYSATDVSNAIAADRAKAQVKVVYE